MKNTSKAMRIVGWIVGLLPCLLLLFSGVMKLMRPPAVYDGFRKLGLPTEKMLLIGIIEVGCGIVYLIPRTAVLGAILITGYMGGAMLTHLRIGEPYVMQFLVGIVAWLGIYLRDARVRELLPLRSTRSA